MNRKPGPSSDSKPGPKPWPNLTYRMVMVTIFSAQNKNGFFPSHLQNAHVRSYIEFPSNLPPPHTHTQKKKIIHRKAMHVAPLFTLQF